MKPTLALLGTVLISAYFWYAMLATIGAFAVACGVSLQFGVGYGLIAFGVLCVLGSEVVRGGMIRG
jgi:hypothetical protein